MSRTDDIKAIRRADRARRLEALRDGRRQLAHRFKDRRKEAERKGARGRSVKVCGQD